MRYRNYADRGKPIRVLTPANSTKKSSCCKMRNNCFFALGTEVVVIHTSAQYAYTSLLLFMRAILGRLLGISLEAAQSHNRRADSFLRIPALRANSNDTPLAMSADALFGVSQANQIFLSVCHLLAPFEAFQLLPVSKRVHKKR